MADIVAIGLRGLAFAAALQAAGAVLFVRLFGGQLDLSAPPIRRLAVAAGAVALLLTFAHALIEPTRLTGEFASIFDGSLHALLLGSDAGTATAIRVAGLALILGGTQQRSAPGNAAALIGATLTAASFALTGHTASDEQRWLLAPLLIVHLLVVAFWFGALWPLATVARCEMPAVGGKLIGEFSRLAVRLVPAILIAGTVIAAFLLPDLASLGSSYGRMLLAKVAAFALLLGLAAANKWRFGPGVGRGDRAAVVAFRRTVLAEGMLIFAVVVLTAVMTALFSPTLS